MIDDIMNIYYKKVCEDLRISGPTKINGIVEPANSFFDLFPQHSIVKNMLRFL